MPRQIVTFPSRNSIVYRFAGFYVSLCVFACCLFSFLFRFQSIFYRIYFSTRNQRRRKEMWCYHFILKKHSNELKKKRMNNIQWGNDIYLNSAFILSDIVTLFGKHMISNINNYLMHDPLARFHDQSIFTMVINMQFFFVMQLALLFQRRTYQCIQIKTKSIDVILTNFRMSSTLKLIQMIHCWQPHNRLVCKTHTHFFSDGILSI